MAVAAAMVVADGYLTGLCTYIGCTLHKLSYNINQKMLDVGPLDESTTDHIITIRECVKV